jgi:hypothetical protein
LPAGISLAIIAAVNGLGTKLNAKFTSINVSLHENLGSLLFPRIRSSPRWVPRDMANFGFGTLEVRR